MPHVTRIGGLSAVALIAALGCQPADGSGSSPAAATAGSSASASDSTSGTGNMAASVTSGIGGNTGAASGRAQGSSGSTGGTSGSTGGVQGTGGASTGTASTGGSSASSTSGGSTTGASSYGDGGVLFYGIGQGLQESPVDVSTDEAGNLWVVSNAALYLLAPGQSQFHRYTGADGLNLAMAGSPGIMAVAGGHAGEVFVGYNDIDITDTQNDPNRLKGMMDAVTLNSSGTLNVTRVVEHNDDYVVGSATQGGITDSDFTYYEDRGVRRLLFDHSYHPGTLYIGWNHGVSMLDWDHPDPTTGLPYADHVHPEVYTSDGTSMQAEFRGLALDPTARVDSMGGNHSPGVLWVGGEFTGGAVDWKSVLYQWSDNSDNPLVEAFSSPPIWPVASPGDPVNVRAVAVRANGDVWFASGPEWDPQTDTMWGLAKWSGNQLSYVEPSAIGLPTRQLWDLVAMPDGSLAIATDQGLYFWNPDTNHLEELQGLPTSTITQLYLDRMVNPPILYAVTDMGIAVIP